MTLHRVIMSRLTETSTFKGKRRAQEGVLAQETDPLVALALFEAMAQSEVLSNLRDESSLVDICLELLHRITVEARPVSSRHLAVRYLTALSDILRRSHPSRSSQDTNGPVLAFLAPFLENEKGATSGGSTAPGVKPCI